MPRRVSVEDLVAAGVPKEQAERAMAKVNEPKPRSIWWQFQGTEQLAGSIMKEHPGLTIVKRFKPREDAAAGVQRTGTQVPAKK